MVWSGIVRRGRGRVGRVRSGVQGIVEDLIVAVLDIRRVEPGVDPEAEAADSEHHQGSLEPAQAPVAVSGDRRQVHGVGAIGILRSKGPYNKITWRRSAR